ncbi:unknown [Clostridium sp. CAG:354]|mgnify:FL=1|nr:unknown [Clostridium sp. CAG:354]
MKISELKGKKIVHICVILGIIVLILIIAGIIMLRYQVEGETNLPFELSKMIVVSTAESNEIEAVADTKWNFSVNQYNDIYLEIQKNDQYTKNTNIKNITFENFVVEKNSGAENIKLYRANSEGKVVEDEAHLVGSSLTYKGEKETNLDELKISNQGSIILLRSVNQNVCEVRSNDEEIIHDGTLLAKGNTNSEDLNYKLSFDIIIETSRNIKYKGTITIDLPTGDVQTQGKTQLEKTDFSDVIFKRM